MAQALLQSSGATDFNPSLADFVIESYSRIQVRPPSLTRDHFVQARLSSNLLFSEWSNIGMPLLFQTRRLQIPLIPGISSYTLPSNVIAPLDAFVRQYFTGNDVNFLPAFTAPPGSTVWNVYQPQHGYRLNQMVWFPGQVAAGGIIIGGAYIISGIVDANNYNITTTEPSSGTGNILFGDNGQPLTDDNGQLLTDGTGLYPPVVPTFSATAGTDLIGVNLPGHGMSSGLTYYINITLNIGGMMLNGGFTVVGVPDQNNFQIQVNQDAVYGTGEGSPPVYLTGDNGQILLDDNGNPIIVTPGVPGTPIMLNGGLAQARTELYHDNHIDFILYPLSRTEYAMQPDKQIEYRPTTFWFDRQINPKIVFWNVPDNFGPYVMNIWVMQQQDDAVIEGGVGVGVPYRWFDAFCSGLALRLCRKFPPDPRSGTSIVDLRAEYQSALQAALREDTERTPFFLTPGLTSYFR
jgi:hypothetical protein